MAREQAPVVVGRYTLYGELARGGMASVLLGRLSGAVGFSRTVAVKRMHPQFAGDPEFVAMFTDEARLAARIRHPNVVPTLDVVAQDDDLFLVMDYVEGESVAKLIRHGQRVGRPMPLDVAVAIASGMLQGLHAAHEARSESGEPLALVHRDVSPQNVLVGVDGVARVLDFGVAKAAGRLQSTAEGQFKGKIAYMSVEQMNGQATRRTDVYAAGVVAWEMVTGRRLFAGDDPVAVMNEVLRGQITPASIYRDDLPPELDAILLRATARLEEERFDTALEFALELERAVRPAGAVTVGAWVRELAGAALDERARRVAEMESESRMVLQPSTTDASASEPITRVADATEGVAATSSPSMVAVSASHERVVGAPPRSSSRAPAWIALAVVAVAGLVAWGVTRGGGTSESSGAASSTQGASGAQRLELAPTARVAPSTVAASPSVAPLGAPSPSPSASTSSSAARPATALSPDAGAPKTLKNKPSGAPTTTAKVADPKADCTPPYTIDKDGNTHFKVHCLE